MKGSGWGIGDREKERSRRTLVSKLGWVIGGSHDGKGGRREERARCCFSGFGGHCR
jgi:hypothetical protein